MARIDWNSFGQRTYEAGIDRGILFVKDEPGVPWFGLRSVKTSQAGGEAKPRYLDGIKVSNKTSPQEFEGTIEAFHYPTQFEQCDGTKHISNGLRVKQQRRKSFCLSYRVLVGNDTQGLDHGYKIHILYNLRAEPSESEHETLNEDTEPLMFSWDVTARTELISGVAPSAHYEIDSRDTPPELLQLVEDTLYGTINEDPSLPSAGLLAFIFSSFEDNVYDAGSPFTPIYITYDAGSPATPYTNTIDGGALNG